VPADLQELKAQFDSWRERQVSRRVPIPEPLRQAAQALLARYPASRICRVCRLHPRTLKEMTPAETTRGVAPADRTLAFYALPPPPDADCRLWLERADGARLSLVLPALDATALETLCATFLRS
jgi:hypothetical protein